MSLALVEYSKTNTRLAIEPDDSSSVAIEYHGHMAEEGTLKLKYSLRCQPPKDSEFRFTAADIDMTFPRGDTTVIPLAISLARPNLSDSRSAGYDKLTDQGNEWTDDIDTLIRGSQVVSCSFHEPSTPPGGLWPEYTIIVSTSPPTQPKPTYIRVHVKAQTSDGILWEIGGKTRDASLLISFD